MINMRFLLVILQCKRGFQKLKNKVFFDSEVITNQRGSIIYPSAKRTSKSSEGTAREVSKKYREFQKLLFKLYIFISLVEIAFLLFGVSTHNLRKFQLAIPLTANEIYPCDRIQKDGRAYV